ncbi:MULTISPECIES: AraC family transcriptional regulator [Alphaproteobacteria]|uniref:AraC family transcriptional regulator n=2 Tax=Alphaproteobacteria TaxID=28211 RepID=A0A512HMX0_9HYPH|nr:MULTISPECIES: AraC family transcriptional regulator [Alphaproteobacteria]GEO86740.1 AraC family transcriptional regulator [Ciceribacter naphthalenivorans]GLR20791.1 AraC family transcriptional regulator [Ciceribacter naphthalenivorans]GLT03647.1 AraC family transcriptional regulator [Sphingomonas psychrolutea]
MDKLDEIRALAIRHAGIKHPGMARLSIFSITEPTKLNALVYNPMAFIVLQGTKRTLIGDQVFEYGPGQTMVVAAEITAMGQIIEASPDKPFLAINLDLDPAVIMNVVLYLSETPEMQMQPGFAFSMANAELIGAWQRLLAMYERPKEIPVMALHLEHELMFRLMLSPHAEMLRQIAGVDSRLSHIRQAMAWIREHYTQQLSIEDMAAVAGMSESVFHRRFKAVTALSPLQYQKHIRLQEARRRMVSKEADAASVSFAVGYKSTSQFSREYKRLFGEPPRRDADMVQTMVETGLQ